MANTFEKGDKVRVCAKGSWMYNKLGTVTQNDGDYVRVYVEGEGSWHFAYSELAPVLKWVTSGETNQMAGAVTGRATLPEDSTKRKEHPMYTGLLKYFPAALAGVAKVSKVGNEKHQPGKPMQHARGKSADHEDCILRHLVDLSEDRGHGAGRDENGIAQVLYIAWRSLALAQEWLEKNDGAPVAPAATFDEKDKADIK